MSESAKLPFRSFSQLFIGGSWQDPATNAVIDIVNPATEEHIGTVPEGSIEDIDKAVAAARKAFDEGPWPRMTAAERAGFLRRIGKEVDARVPEMVSSFTQEIGAPTGVSQAFHANAMAMWEDAATLYQRLPFEEDRPVEGGTVRLVREAIGVVATIIPWNGPVATASLKLGPALAAGCTVVLKPAPEGPASAMILAEAIEAAGLPEGVVSIIPAGREVGEYLVKHKDVDKVAFTGSTAAGKKIMSLCSERLARVTLELGGKSAGIILEDADLDTVIPSLVPAGIISSGQVCAALTRVLVPTTRHDEVVDAIAAAMKEFPVGDPLEPGVVIGPLAAERQRDRVESYIKLGVEEGATIVTGGGRPAGQDKGWFIEPTLFSNVTSDMRIAQEEIFGPVVVVIPFDDVESAIEIANDTDYGLSGAVYTQDVAQGEYVARRVRTGQIYVNTWGMCVTQPFGGYKQSGIGREGGVEGLAPYLETKLIQGLAV